MSPAVYVSLVVAVSILSAGIACAWFWCSNLQYRIELLERMNAQLADWAQRQGKPCE